MTIITKKEFLAGLIQFCLKSGRKGLPRRKRQKHILLKSASLLFDPYKIYSESEVNSALRLWIAAVAIRLEIDHATLRREMVNEGYLERDDSGFVYTLGLPETITVCYEESIDTMNIVWTAVELMEVLTRKEA